MEFQSLLAETEGGNAQDLRGTLLWPARVRMGRAPDEADDLSKALMMRSSARNKPDASRIDPIRHTGPCSGPSLGDAFPSYEAVDA